MGRRLNDHRGNSRDRKVRKLKLLAHYGNGVTVACVWCNDQLTYETVEADRIDPNKFYRFDNVLPSCRRCNASRGNRSIEDYFPLAPNPQLAIKLLFDGAFA